MKKAIVEAYDELYWNVTGTEWPVPIDAASSTVRLPAAATGVRAHAFTGGYGSTGQDAVGPRSRGLADRYTAPTGRSRFREGLTIGIGWDAGVVERPTAIGLASTYLFANWPLFLPFFAFAFMYRRWNERGRDPEVGSIEPRYEPPEQLTPAEVGVIIDNRADLRDITATLVDLAVRGHHDDRGGGREADAGPAHRHRTTSSAAPTPTRGTLAPHESALLEAVFDGRRTRRLSELKDRFYKDLPRLKSQLLATLIEHGVYSESPARVAGKYVGLGFFVGIAIFFGGRTRWSGSLQLAPLAIMTGRDSSPPSSSSGSACFMPARTKRGTELAAPGEGVRGVPHPGRGRALPADDHRSGDVREVPPVRDGARRRRAVGARLRGPVPRAAGLVSRARLPGLQRPRLRVQSRGQCRWRHTASCSPPRAAPDRGASEARVSPPAEGSRGVASGVEAEAPSRGTFQRHVPEAGAWNNRERRDSCTISVGDRVEPFTLAVRGRRHDRPGGPSGPRAARPPVLPFRLHIGLHRRNSAGSGTTGRRFAALDAAVFGISVDSPFVTSRFRAEEDIPFPHPVRLQPHRFATTGASCTKSLMGLRGVAKRAAFVIGRDEKVAYAWVSEDPRVEADYEEVRQAVADAACRAETRPDAPRRGLSPPV